MSNAPRPDVSQLPLVPDDEWILRRIPPEAFVHDPPDGKHLTTACFTTGDFKATASNYGASAFVESRLSSGLADLIRADASWSDCGIIRVQVKELKALKIEIRYTPQDYTYSDPIAKDAHASFIGISNRTERDKLLELLESFIHKKPPDP